MKNLKAPVAGLFLFIMAMGCRKNDFQELPTETAAEATAPVAAAKPAGTSASGWVSINNWKSAEHANYSVYYANLAVNGVSEESDANGLVKVFKMGKDGQAAVTLPYEETVNGQKFYWYYQVSEGSLMIAVDVYGKATNPGVANQFKYVTLSSHFIQEKEKQGISRADIMNMSFDKTADLLK